MLNNGEVIHIKTTNVDIGFPASKIFIWICILVYKKGHLEGLTAISFIVFTNGKYHLLINIMR